MKELVAARARVDRGALPVFPREAKKFEPSRRDAEEKVPDGGSRGRDVRADQGLREARHRHGLAFDVDRHAFRKEDRRGVFLRETRGFPLQLRRKVRVGFGRRVVENRQKALFGRRGRARGRGPCVRDSRGPRGRPSRSRRRLPAAEEPSSRRDGRSRRAPPGERWSQGLRRARPGRRGADPGGRPRWRRRLRRLARRGLRNEAVRSLRSWSLSDGLMEKTG